MLFRKIMSAQNNLLSEGLTSLKALIFMLDEKRKKAHLLSTYYTLSTANAKVFNVPNELKSLWA